MNKMKAKTRKYWWRLTLAFLVVAIAFAVPRYIQKPSLAFVVFVSVGGGFAALIVILFAERIWKKFSSEHAGVEAPRGDV